MLHGLEVGGCGQPERTLRTVSDARGQASTRGSHVGGCNGVEVFDDVQHKTIEPCPHIGPRLQRWHRHTIGQAEHRVPVRCLPQISGVYALRSGQLLHITVLRKQRHGADLLAIQHGFQVLDQTEPGPFHLGHSHLVAQHGLGEEALHGPFHPAHHTGCGVKPHHFKRTHHLVQLRAGHAQ